MDDRRQHPARSSSSYARPGPPQAERGRQLAAWAVLAVIVLAVFLLSLGLLAAVLF